MYKSVQYPPPPGGKLPGLSNLLPYALYLFLSPRAQPDIYRQNRRICECRTGSCGLEAVPNPRSEQKRGRKAPLVAASGGVLGKAVALSTPEAGPENATTTGE
jgi:hypothetical protein